MKGLDPSMAASMDMVENNMDGSYKFEDMTDETKSRAVRLYSLLTSYVRQRPLKLIRHVKSENGFEAWQCLLMEMQPATRARALALLSQLSRIQFAEGKTVSEQLPQFEALVMEYERISSQKYSDDAKVASILLACPLQIRQHLHLWITDATTYYQLKDRIVQLEAVTTKWDSTNSLLFPTRATGDEATPMEVDYVGKVGKGKKGLKGKGKDAKGKDKGKDKGKYGSKEAEAQEKETKGRASGRKALQRRANQMQHPSRSLTSLHPEERVETTSHGAWEWLRLRFMRWRSSMRLKGRSTKTAMNRQWRYQMMWQLLQWICKTLRR